MNTLELLPNQERTDVRRLEHDSVVTCCYSYPLQSVRQTTLIVTEPFEIQKAIFDPFHCIKIHHLRYFSLTMSSCFPQPIN